MDHKQQHRQIVWYRLKRFLGRTAIVLFMLLLVINTILQTETVQSFIAHKASNYLSKQLDIHIKIEKVRISLMMDVLLEGVRIDDAHQNQMITIKYFYARLQAAQLTRSVFRLSEVEMIEGGFTLRKYKGERFFNYTDLIGIPDTTKEKSSDIAFELYCKNAKLTDCYFNMINENNPSREGFDWNNMHLKLHKVEGRNLAVNNDEISVDIRDIKVSDTSGFQVDKFTTVMRFADDGWYFDNAFILTPKSTLDFDLKFGYSSFDHIGEFVDSITIISEIRPSILAISDVAFFTQSLKDYPIIAELETKFNGTLHDFSVKDFRMKSGQHTDLSMEARLQGILEPETANMGVIIDHLSTSFDDIKQMNIPIGDFQPPDPLLEQFSLSAYFDGTIDDFEADVVINTEMGNAAVQLNMSHQDSINNYVYQGFVTGNRINAGKLLDLKPDVLGACTFKVDFNGSGLALNNANINLNASIDSLDAMQYVYKNIALKGTLQDRKFDGLANIDDQNIKLDFNGLVDFQDTLPRFNFEAGLNNVFLSRLNLLSGRADDLRLSSNITIKARGNSVDNLRGNISIDNFKMVESDSVYAFKTLRVITFEDTITKERNIKIRSDLLDANLSGDFQLSNLDNTFQKFIENHITSIRFASDSVPTNSFDLSDNLNWDIQLKDISPITRFFIPQLQIPNGFSVSQNIDFEENKMTTKCNAPLIIYSGVKGIDFHLNASTQPYGTDGDLGFSKVSIIEENDSTIFGMEEFNINTLIKDDTLKYSISWDRILGKETDISYLDGRVSLINYPDLSITFTDMTTVLSDITKLAWHVDPNNSIVFDSTGIAINNLRFFSDSSYAYFNGEINDNDSSLLFAEISNGNLSGLNKILNLSGINTYGQFSGKINLHNPFNNLFVAADLQIDQWRVNENKLGDAAIRFEWDSKEPSAFIDLHSVLSESYGDIYPLAVKGHYYPDNPNKNFDLSVKLENIGLDILNPFLNEYVSNIKGNISGEMQASGTQKNPKIDGEFTVQRGMARILYTGVLYSLSGKIIANDRGFAFQDFELKDSLANVAALKGEIRHKGFQDFYLDVSLSPKNVTLFNTKRFSSDIFYGTIRTTGTISATGPFDKIDVKAKVTTDKGTEITIPLNTAESVEASTFVVFIQPSDSIHPEPPPVINPSAGFSLDLNVNVTPDGTIMIYLPGDAGKITAIGNGDMQIKLGENGDFGLFGNYVIQKGDLNLTIQQMNIPLINKKLSLNKGSTIQFNGDPLSANMNVSATYEVTTTLKNLNLASALDSSQINKSIPVNCVIHMRDKLSDPELSFSIEFPTLHDDDVKAGIYAKIDTTNAAEMTRQAFSLLLFSTFTSDESSGGSAGSMLANTSFSMLTNQINNWLSHMIKGVDIGVNYRSGDQASNDEFDVFIRKGMFNDRVIIDANVGRIGGNDNAGQSSTAAIDASVEIKITNAWRFKAFNRSNANDISKVGSTNEYGYTYGVGASYNRSFNRAKDIFTDYKEERKQRREEKARKAEEKSLQKKP